MRFTARFQYNKQIKNSSKLIHSHICDCNLFPVANTVRTCLCIHIERLNDVGMYLWTKKRRSLHFPTEAPKKRNENMLLTSLWMGWSWNRGDRCVYALFGISLKETIEKALRNEVRCRRNRILVTLHSDKITKFCHFRGLFLLLLGIASRMVVFFFFFFFYEAMLETLCVFLRNLETQ